MLHNLMSQSNYTHNHTQPHKHTELHRTKHSAGTVGGFRWLIPNGKMSALTRQSNVENYQLGQPHSPTKVGKHTRWWEQCFEQDLMNELK